MVVWEVDSCGILGSYMAFGRQGYSGVKLGRHSKYVMMSYVSRMGFVYLQAIPAG